LSTLADYAAAAGAVNGRIVIQINGAHHRYRRTDQSLDIDPNAVAGSTGNLFLSRYAQLHDMNVNCPETLYDAL
jgi:hypothetical protein